MVSVDGVSLPRFSPFDRKDEHENLYEPPSEQRRQELRGTVRPKDQGLHSLSPR